MRLLALILLFAGPGDWAADRAAIVTDLPLTQSLVAEISGEEPTALVAAGANPHHLQLRPSQVKALARADLLVWIGPGLTPWLGEELQAINPDAQSLALAGSDGDHAGEHDEAEGHPWLDPRVVAAWVAEIAGALAAVEPDRATEFHANADALVAGIEALDRTLAARLEPARPLRLVVAHDAYRALAGRYGLYIVASVADDHDIAPGAADLAALRKTVAAGEVDCLFAEPDSDPAVLDTIAGKSGVFRGSLDPEGLTLPPAPGLYARLMEALASGIEACMAANGLAPAAD